MDCTLSPIGKQVSCGLHWLQPLRTAAPHVTTPPQGAAMPLEIRTIPSMRLASMRYIGPYGHPALTRLWERFGQWCAENGLAEPRPRFYGISHDNPACTPPIVYAACTATTWTGRLPTCRWGGWATRPTSVRSPPSCAPSRPVTSPEQRSRWTAAARMASSKATQFGHGCLYFRSAASDRAAPWV